MFLDYPIESNFWKNLIHFIGKKSELRYLLVFIQTIYNSSFKNRVFPPLVRVHFLNRPYLNKNSTQIEYIP